MVEFGEEDQEDNVRSLRDLKDLMGELGLGWDKSGAEWGGLIEV